MDPLPRSNELHPFVPGPAAKTYCRARVLDEHHGLARYCWEKDSNPVHRWLDS